MPKVITSQTLEEFVRNGTSLNIEPHKPASKSVPSLEVVHNVPVANEGATPATAKTPAVEAVATAEELRDAESFGKAEYERRRLAEEENAELRRKLAENRTPTQQPAVPAVDPHAPKISQFTDSNGVVDWDRLTTAKSEYASQKAVQQERNRVDAEARDAAFKDRLADAQTRYPDFLEVLEKADVMIQDDVLAHISDSPLGADLTYYLAKHADETERIRALHPRQALAEIGKLEERAPWKKATANTPPPAETPKETKQARTAPAESSPSTRRVREAPAPINALPPSAGAGNAPVDPSKMDYRQLREYERNRARNRGARR